MECVFKDLWKLINYMVYYKVIKSVKLYFINVKFIFIVYIRVVNDF